MSASGSGFPRSMAGRRRKHDPLCKCHPRPKGEHGDGEPAGEGYPRLRRSGAEQCPIPSRAAQIRFGIRNVLRNETPLHNIHRIPPLRLNSAIRWPYRSRSLPDVIRLQTRLLHIFSMWYPRNSGCFRCEKANSDDWLAMAIWYRKFASVPNRRGERAFRSASPGPWVVRLERLRVGSQARALSLHQS